MKYEIEGVDKGKFPVLKIEINGKVLTYTMDKAVLEDGKVVVEYVRLPYFQLN